MNVLWKIFGNNDDWPPPDWYMPEERERKRKLYWLLRNPLHNLTFYLIGVAGKPFVRTGKFPQDVFNPNGGWNLAVTAYKWFRLPFVSYLGRSIKFYIGWRERGNFGFKLTGRRG